MSILATGLYLPVYGRVNLLGMKEFEYFYIYKGSALFLSSAEALSTPLLIFRLIDPLPTKLVIGLCIGLFLGEPVAGLGSPVSILD